MTEPEIAVIGAGIVGLSTAFALTEHGAPVVVYERSAPGNAQSGGESRIFRHSHDDRRLVVMARDARGVWREWEDRFRRELLSRDGVVAIGPPMAESLVNARGRVTSFLGASVWVELDPADRDRIERSTSRKLPPESLVPRYCIEAVS